VHSLVMRWFFDLREACSSQAFIMCSVANRHDNKQSSDALTTIFMSAMDSLDLANGVHLRQLDGC
jgi:hypothetical protein